MPPNVQRLYRVGSGEGPGFWPQRRVRNSGLAGRGSLSEKSRLPSQIQAIRRAFESNDRHHLAILAAFQLADADAMPRLKAGLFLAFDCESARARPWPTSWRARARRRTRCVGSFASWGARAATRLNLRRTPPAKQGEKHPLRRRMIEVRARHIHLPFCRRS
jgi:hypothetical protein